MALVTVEVEIEHGRVIPLGPEPLPEKGRGLLTLLPEGAEGPSCGSVTEFIEKWAGAFALPGQVDDDPRLADLVRKHVK
ncbi:MAG TPA: hypothetical protein VGM54_00585 [Chthoniobacter sp.]